MYSRNEVEKIVLNAVDEAFTLEQPINDSNVSFINDLDAGSLTMLTFAMILEDEFSLELVEEEQFREFITINNVIDYILEQQEKKTS